jgi:hypothetical protein
MLAQFVYGTRHLQRQLVVDFLADSGKDDLVVYANCMQVSMFPKQSWSQNVKIGCGGAQ